MTSLNVGDRAPDFTLPSAEGKNVSLSDFLGKKSVVIYFYPKDDTPGCTIESCTFRDSYEEFKEAGAEVIGISSDSPQSHQQFASKYQLPFILLSDSQGKVRKLFDVPNVLFLLPGRVTYVIDKEGIVRHIFNSMMDFKAHVDEALKTIKSL
ncbi:peroxiredoxin [Cyanobacterium aponinum UTEX 3222]|uniref:thioredoxin-dependent peroxiredoxin n=4 Tax=Cyanobacterium TaxID=102234 RepID=K9Z5Q7_CYAAP|nr:peroxiredoxin [Cyanobacterium aponinum]WRL43569.1 peroxiredoxin [Cyanobacterium aponinum UTEX 3222]AFZ54484.1 Peroxiredoxin [Cyanobacterium aponinum PCC 10605]MTF40756.1 redoxin domain-containing protein [Cyanobacterium aponinum 0216]PHV61374.1 peroxiredoxin [Cyanobacterium aponinum IPPAS B-1201]WPF88114.1 peroxiredoxin [Cyanobacterium aponinum AL20115]